MHTPRTHPVTALDLDLSDEQDSQALLFAYACAHLDIDLLAPGKQRGHLCLPGNDPASTPSQLRIPICVLNGAQPGPTVTFLAGIHGDEFDGPLVLQQLSRALNARTIRGRVIILPCLNPNGLARGQRHTTSDALNLDLCFPGSSQGSVSERLAHELVQRIISQSDWIVDLRSGGQSLTFSSCAAVRFDPDATRQSHAEGAMIAFGAPYSVRLPASRDFSCLQGTVAGLGKPYVQILMGGGGGSTVDSLEMARQGCRNVLRHCGILGGDIELSATRLLEVRNDLCYVYAPCSGLFEPCNYLGREIWQGDILARIVDLHDYHRPPVELVVPRDSILLASHHGGPVLAGALIAIIAEEVQA